jgi:hypothetical protein
MKESRLIDRSILFYLRENIWLEAQGEVAETSDYITYYGEQDNWVWTRPVAVYSNGNPVPSTDYRVDYLSGAVVFEYKLSPTDTIALYYSYNWADIVDEYPDELFEKPVIALLAGPSSYKPLELGGADQRVISYYAEVFALNVGQRDDLADELVELLRKDIYLVDYNYGFPIDEDGSKNKDFSADTQRIGLIEFANPEILPNPTNSDDENERTRVSVSFSVTVTFW